MAEKEVKHDREVLSNRMWASISFVGVLIIIGLPLWWKTTEVYRVSLPYDKISSFHTLTHTIQTELTILANDEATAAEIVGLIEKTFEDSDIIKLKIKKQVLSEALRHTLDSVADELEAVEEVAKNFDLQAHNTFYVVQRKPLFQDVWLAGERVMFFRDAKASQTVAHALASWVYQLKTMGAGGPAPAPASHLVLSVVHPEPDRLQVDFPAEEAMEDYIGSFVDELSVLHNFTLSSQWLYLLDFDFEAREVKDTTEWGRHFAVNQDKLHLLLTRLEERAATHVSELPTINLALYVVPCHLAPLAIYDNNDKKIPTPVQAFMSPKWGGVVLGNPTAAECRGEGPTWRPHVRVIMGTFIAQLRKILGIIDMEPIKGAHLEPLRSVVPRRWEVDALLRSAAARRLAAAAATLHSLAQLLGEISNIVINDEVGASINTAVDSIQLASELMRRGELVAAHLTSQKAFLAAETAFMEPSLLSLLYFPDDQKYAIYIPLFLPIMFPVILSLKNLSLWLRGKPLPKEKSD